jgi:microcystin-dependent protein
MKYLILTIALLASVYKANCQPIGSVTAYAGELNSLENDSSYMNCDGRILKIQDYPLLCKRIGWTYLKQTDTINTVYFRLPDYQGYFLRGVDTTTAIDKNSKTRTNSNGEVIGSLVGSIETDTLKSHKHSINDPGHNHGMRDDNLSDGRKNFSGAEVTMHYAGQAPKPNSATGITILETGGEETRPINISVYWIIKVK